MPNGDRLVINTFVKGTGLSRLDTRIENGWVSTCYGQRTEAPVAVFEASGDGPMEFTTVIAPSPLDELSMSLCDALKE